MSEALRKKDRKWLAHIGVMSAPGPGMYRGDRCDLVPHGPADRLYKRGLIDILTVTNMSHKDRWIITDAGRAELERTP